MRLLRTTHQGLTVFSEPKTIDYEELGPGLIAITGRNGAGKTTCMEVAPASLFRVMPTRPGSLYEHSSGSNCFIESLWLSDEGKQVRVRIVYDAEKRKSEGFIYKNDVAVCDGRTGDFREKIESLFGSSNLFLASVFATQDRSGSLLTMRKAERKALFVELLGLGHLEKISVAAREREKIEDSKVEALRLSQESLAEGAVPVEEAARGLRRAELRREDSEVGERSARSQLEDAEKIHQEAYTRVATIDGLRLRESETKRAWAEAGAAYDGASRHLAECIDREKARGAALLERLLAEKRSLPKAAINEVPAAEVRHEEAAEAHRVACEKLAAMPRNAASIMTERKRDLEDLERLAATQQQVPCEGVGEYATCSFLKATRRATPQAIEEARAAYEAAKTDDAEGLILTDAVAEADKDRQEALSHLQAARLASGVRDRIARIEVELEAQVQEQAEVVGQRKQVAEMAMEKMEAARVAHAAAKDDVDAQSGWYDALRNGERLLAEAKKNCLEAAQEAQAAFAAHELALAAFSNAEKCASKLSKVEIDLELARTSQTDWQLLSRGFGKDGVQALEIDNAAPEVSGITNDLLAACYGPRFSVTLETLREKKDGTTREAFDVQVYDGKSPRLVESLSGGERVIVNEALSLALAIYNARKNRVRYRTLWRDETAGALDPDNASAYVLMLRKAMALGGFANVIFVAHLPAVCEAADARVEL